MTASRSRAGEPDVGERIHIAGTPVDLVTLTETIRLIDRAIQENRAFRHVAINAAKVVSAQEDAELRRALVESELATADGQAIVWAARALGHNAPERVTGIDLMQELLTMAEEKGYGIYLLGARSEVVGRLVAMVRARYGGLRICGYRDGYFGPDEEASIVRDISQSGADMLFVAMATPAKELFLARHHDRLAVPFRMGVGGAFDVLVGLQRRAPDWMQRTGLEWFYRLVQEPRRMWKRYLVGNSRFLALVWREIRDTGPSNSGQGF